MSSNEPLSYSVTEIRGATRSLLLVTKDPRQALSLAKDCRTRSGPFYRVEITDAKGRLVLDCELIDEMKRRDVVSRPNKSTA